MQRAEQRRQDRADKLAEKLSDISKREKAMQQQPKFYELKDGETLGKKKSKADKANKVMSLADRLENDDSVVGEVLSNNKAGHQMTFKATKSRGQLKAAADAKAHREERLSVRRSASHLKKKKLAPKFYQGKRVS